MNNELNGCGQIQDKETGRMYSMADFLMWLKFVRTEFEEKVKEQVRKKVSKSAKEK